MERAVEQLVRQQYLVPRRSVAKLRQLSKLQKVSATEIVRRAIDAYDPLADDRTAQEAAALELLAEVHEQLRKAIRNIDADMAALRLRQSALEDGSVRDRARRDTESWLRRNPRALAGFTQLFVGQRPQPTGARSGEGSARSGGNGARLRALRR
jgi:uncharacterized protein YhaN